jgi:hypothetical protein
MDAPNNYGYMNVYIRETCRDDRRYSYNVMRFPYVEYNRGQFRKY